MQRRVPSDSNSLEGVFALDDFEIVEDEISEEVEGNVTTRTRKRNTDRGTWTSRANQQNLSYSGR